MRRLILAAIGGLLATVAPILAAPAAPKAPAAAAPERSADRVYAIDCGTLSAPDKSLWTPGKNVGTPALLSENCYLIKHGRDYLLWDTGISDKLTGKPLTTHGMTLTRDTPLVAQLAAIGVSPSQIKLVAVSHTHPDHTGNLDLVGGATLLIQRKEVEWSAGAGFLKLAPERPVQQLDGDHDVFGDGSVMILATPGHTPGHQSLLVHLKNTGWLLLSGDVAHLRENYEANVSPRLNVDAAATLQSIDRVKAIVAAKKATLWINHETADSAQVKRPPAFYD